MKKIIYLVIFIILLNSVTAIIEIKSTERGITLSEVYDEITRQDKPCIIVREDNESKYFMQVIKLTTLVEQLNNRVIELESILNETKIEPPLIQLYSCESKENEECPGGLSGINKEGFQTRCYNPYKIGWKTCNTGWKMKNIIIKI